MFVENYGDLRQLASCVHCGGATGTKDHVPSKILLDEPYPANLHQVPACRACNQGLSLDEEYVACLVDCALIESATPNERHRSKVKAVLDHSPALVSMLNNARRESEAGVVFEAESSRVLNVVIKLARAHAVYELNEPQLDTPLVASFQPFTLMDIEIRKRFEFALPSTLWPEVGSRAMQK